MTEAAFFEPRRISPAGIGVVIAIHAGVITVAALSRIDVVRQIVPPIIVRNVPLPEDPPPEPTKAKRHDLPKPIPVPSPQPDPIVDHPPVDKGPIVKLSPPPPFPPIGGDTGPPLDPPKPPPSVRIDAQFDPRFGDVLKPPYPLQEVRQGIEGTVTLRVLIGADGRVKAVEKLAATTDGFFRAAERQALARWRFKPATLDGRPIESRKVMTLRFELDA